MGTDPERERRGRRPILGLILAPALSAIVWVLLASGGSSLGPTGRVVAVVGVLMAVLWLTEALPVAATALLPIALLPVLSGGELGIREVTAPYANEMIFLFMGGFMLALAMQKWGLHRRIALHIILLVGDRPSSIVLGFMLASGFLSMWISNTATTVMMLPIALSVIELVRQRLGDDAPTGDFAFAIALLLGTAYGASIGGTATLIGTPPNLFMAGFMSDNYGVEITFGEWLPFGLTFAVVMLPLTWLVLTRVVFPIRVGRIPGGRELIREELVRCGPMSRQEKAVLVVFSLTALAWVFRSPLSDLRLGGNQPLAGLSDAGIAILSSLLLFGLPLGESRRKKLRVGSSPVRRQVSARLARRR